MKLRLVFLLYGLLWFGKINAQNVSDTLTPELLRDYLRFLAADSLGGRGNYTPQLYRAAHFIADQYAKAGLVAFPSLKSYFQPFDAEVPDASKTKKVSAAFDSASVLLNVIGVLPGKSKPAEAVIFSAHYDHLGTDRAIGRDSVFNGANDNASGIAALLALAHYYALRNDNERTIVFCAFAGEELGLWGSKAFVQSVNAEKIKAVINLEMVGRAGIGKNAFFITGAHYSDLQKIFVKNLKGSSVKLRYEPSFEKQLFKRSDNYPFALKGVPAHTVMSSDDDDGCYHQPCDELERLDIKHMMEIVKAIAVACTTLINGTDTPTRINPKYFYD